jgi:predicted RNase H-like HicB family nuclease
MAATYTVVLMREEDGRYSVSVPALDGCFTWGKTVAHALRMAEEAIQLYLETLQDEGEPIPPDIPHVSLDMTETAEALVRKVTIGEAAPVA